MPVKLSNLSHKTTIVTDPSCVSTGQTVIVSGALIGQGSNFSYTGVGAVIYNSTGTFIGDGETSLLLVHPAQTVPFKLSVRFSGQAAYCTISWGLAPSGLTDGTPVTIPTVGGTTTIPTLSHQG